MGTEKQQSSFAISLRLRAFAVSSLMLAALAGCKDIGTGGTGELVIPRQTLREVDTVNPAEFATTPPTTVPTTLPSTRAATQPLKEVKIDLAEVRRLSLQNNLDLRVELLNPSIARETLNEEEAAYEWTFTTDAGYGTSDAAPANTVQQQISGTQSQFWRVTPGVRAPLRTGGTIQVGAPITWNASEGNSADTFNPRYASDLTAQITQPLLRGGGIDVNAQPIRVAFYGYQRAQAETKLAVIRVLSDADRDYWRLYAARQELLVRRQEYDLAVAQLDRAKRQVNAGTVAEVEIVRAQSGVADRVEAIIIADNNVRDRERDLKRILNNPDIDMQSPTVLIPATEPVPLYIKIDPTRVVERSMQRRMELLESELAIAQATSDVRVARHELLPLVSLNYTYNVNGLGGSFEDAFAQARGTDFQDHNVGLNIEIPLGNEAARSRLRQALLRRVQELATKAQREAQIRQEVLNAIDQLEANWERILAARQRVVLAQRLLEVQIRQFEQGLQTSTEVLNAQTSLASAQLSEISALTDYQIAQVDIAFASGTLMGAANIVWDPTPVPKN